MLRTKLFSVRVSELACVTGFQEGKREIRACENSRTLHVVVRANYPILSLSRTCHAGYIQTSNQKVVGLPPIGGTWNIFPSMSVTVSKN